MGSSSSSSSPIYIPSDVLFDVFKFCDRFAINEHFELVNAQWSACVALNEQKHFAKYKMDKLWICPLFCSLQYSLTACEQQTTTNAEIFANCTDICKPFYSKFISDDWPAQRIPFCIYIQRCSTDVTTLKKIILNNYVWKIERPECAHFFWHFKDLCFGKVSIDILNDRALTLFLIDCPLFKLHTDVLKVRTCAESWAFMRVVELLKEKTTLKIDKDYHHYYNNDDHQQYQQQQLINQQQMAGESPIAKFILTGRQFCTKLIIETQQFALLFELIEEYKNASDVHHAVPIVRLFVPAFPWHHRPFVEGTLCQTFHVSQKLSQSLHKFTYFDAICRREKFICLVRFEENEEENIECYELRANPIQ